MQIIKDINSNIEKNDLKQDLEFQSSRVTLEMIKEAYSKIKMEPASGYFINSLKTKCCPLTACALSLDPEIFESSGSNNKAYKIQQKLGISFQYRIGFTNGWDGNGSSRESLGQDYKNGVEDAMTIKKNWKINENS